MNTRFQIVMVALSRGQTVTIADEEYSIINNDLCIKRTITRTCGDKSDTSTDWYRCDINFNVFLKMTNSVQDDDLAILASFSVLATPRALASSIEDTGLCIAFAPQEQVLQSE